jgi:predicted nuclease of predicted toxin-antitoxin system
MKLLLDMNIPPRWVGDLVAAGHEAVHWRDVGDIRAGDKALLAYARDAGRVVVTHDLDFGDILAATAGVSPSVVLVRCDDLGARATIDRVIAGLGVASQALASGALVSIDATRERVRMLPLRGQE